MSGPQGMANVSKYGATTTIASAHALEADGGTVAKATQPSALRLRDGEQLSFEHLTPETLLDYCRIKLRGLDEQIQRSFGSQQARNRLSTGLSKLAEAFSNRQRIEAGDQGAKDFVNAAYDGAIAAAGGIETVVGGRLAAEKEKFRLTSTRDVTGDDPSVIDSELRDFMSTVQQIQKDVNLQGDLDMIQLQSLMSGRQQAIQMCTNMVSSLHQASQGVVSNIGK
jgi:hypothetical protein